MSEIPFVERLGDAIEAAIATPQRARRPRRRRFGGLAVAIFLLGAGGVTVAEILDDPEQLAAAPVACYDRASLDGNVSVQAAEGRDPTALCAELLRTRAPLAPCSRGEDVAVFPGPPETCAQLGLKPLPDGFDQARERVARLRADVDAITRSADCIPKADLARRVQAVLQRSGWRGWRAVVDRGQGPCGVVGLPVDVRAGRREVAIFGGPPRSLDRLLDERAGPRLMRESAAHCLTVATLRKRIRRLLRPSGRRVRIAVVRGPMPEYERLEPPARQKRFDEGCAVIDDVFAEFPGGHRIVIRAEIRVRRG